MTVRYRYVSDSGGNVMDREVRPSRARRGRIVNILVIVLIVLLVGLLVVGLAVELWLSYVP